MRRRVWSRWRSWRLTRWSAAGALGGVISVIVTFAACSARGPSSDDSVADAGPPIDGVQVCIDALVRWDEVCPSPDGDGHVERCIAEFRNAGPDCRDKLALPYVCLLAEASADASDPCAYPLKCGTLFNEAFHCIFESGCVPAVVCSASDAGPSGQACDCLETCEGREYVSRCWAEATQSACDCLIDGASVGTCEGGAEPFCSVNLWEGCCNEYFKL